MSVPPQATKAQGAHAAGAAKRKRKKPRAPTKAAQLRYYETHGKVFEQVTAFQGQLTTTINLYLLASGGIWAFVLGPASQLGFRVTSAALVVHLFVSLAAWLVCWGLSKAIVQRFDFLQLLGKRYWPSIEAMGKKAGEQDAKGDKGKAETLRQRWARLVKKLKPWKWGLRQQVRVWPLVPLIGAAASLMLIFWSWQEPDVRTEGCDERQQRIEGAATELEFNRAVFLFKESGCSAREATP